MPSQQTRAALTEAYLRATSPVPEERLQLAQDRENFNQSFRMAEQERKIRDSASSNDLRSRQIDQRDTDQTLRQKEFDERVKNHETQAQRKSDILDATLNLYDAINDKSLDEAGLHKALDDNHLAVENPKVMAEFAKRMKGFDIKNATMTQAQISAVQKQFDDAKSGIAANQEVLDGVKEGEAPTERTLASMALNHQKLIDSGNRLIKADPTAKDAVMAAWQEQHAALEPLASGTSAVYDKAINGYKKMLGFDPIVRPTASTPSTQVAAAQAAAPTASPTPAPTPGGTTADPYAVGKVYKDANGNSATYKGNGAWE